MSKLTSFNAILKDYYPLPGSRIKQYIVDSRRRSEWEHRTCPTALIDAHRDNTDVECRNSGSARWFEFSNHDCCDTCNDYAEELKRLPAVQEWLEERAKLPPVCSDQSLFSDEIEPERLSPVTAFARKR